MGAELSGALESRCCDDRTKSLSAGKAAHDARAKASSLILAEAKRRMTHAAEITKQAQAAKFAKRLPASEVRFVPEWMDGTSYTVLVTRDRAELVQRRPVSEARSPAKASRAASLSLARKRLEKAHAEEVARSEEPRLAKTTLPTGSKSRPSYFSRSPCQRAAAPSQEVTFKEAEEFVLPDSPERSCSQESTATYDSPHSPQSSSVEQSSRDEARPRQQPEATQIPSLPHQSLLKGRRRSNSVSTTKPYLFRF